MIYLLLGLKELNPIGIGKLRSSVGLCLLSSAPSMAVGVDKPQEEASIARFYKVVLSWDYFRLIKESNVISRSLSISSFFFWCTYINIECGALIFAEQKRKRESKEGGALGLKKVKDRYDDVDDYISTFEPLLFEEVKAQICQKKDDDEGTFSSFFITLLFHQFRRMILGSIWLKCVSEISYVLSFFGIAVTEWESRVVVDCNEVDGFHLAVVNYANEEFISQNDLLLLSKVKVILCII